MDPFSVLVGFLVGAITGAAGHYLGEKFTDERRSKESAIQLDEKWEDLKRRFPKVIEEMTTDANNPEMKGVRRFFVKSRGTVLNNSEPSFVYLTNDHADISAALAYLVELGYIEDITPGNCPLYRMKEHFVDKLRGS